MGAAAVVDKLEIGLHDIVDVNEVASLLTMRKSDMGNLLDTNLTNDMLDEL